MSDDLRRQLILRWLGPPEGKSDIWDEDPQSFETRLREALHKAFDTVEVYTHYTPEKEITMGNVVDSWTQADGTIEVSGYEATMLKEEDGRVTVKFDSPYKVIEQVEGEAMVSNFTETFTDGSHTLGMEVRPRGAIPDFRFWHPVPTGATIPARTPFVKFFNSGSGFMYNAEGRKEDVVVEFSRFLTEKKIELPVLPTIPGAMITDVELEPGYAWDRYNLGVLTTSGSWAMFAEGGTYHVPAKAIKRWRRAKVVLEDIDS